MTPREPLPPRLPPEGTTNVLFQSFRTGIAMRELMRTAVEGTGVSGEEYGVLGVLHFFPDRTPTELAAALGIPPTTVSRHVARFLRDGLVERTPNPEDGRSYLLRPTARGSKVVTTIAPRVGKLVEALGRASERPLVEIAESLAPQIGKVVEALGKESAQPLVEIASALVALEDAAKKVAAGR
jgi:DNA-binding MarR family transcriptional regulator